MRAVEIITDDLLLRPWRAADADQVYQACQDPLIQRWTQVPTPYTLAHAVAFVTGVTRDAWTQRTGAPLGVFDRATGALLASNGLVDLDVAAGTGEIGYWTAPWARGRGVAERASRAVAHWALTDFGLRELRWRAEVGNDASRRVAEKVGFRIGPVEPGVLVHRGEPRDAWIGVLRADDLLSGALDGDSPASVAGGTGPRSDASDHV